jgi:tetratricopeptide (TPR) repeat protein
MFPFLLMFISLTASFPSQNQAKEHIAKAEALAKSGKFFEAYQEADAAVQLEPNNKKYNEKLLQIGRTASKAAEVKAAEKMTSDPQEARTWLQAALRYDPSNVTASQSLRAFELRLQNISQKVWRAKAFLDVGRLPDAEIILDSIASYKAVIPSIDGLQKTALSEKHLQNAESLWHSDNPEGAFRELSAAVSSESEALYVKKKSLELRKQFSEFYTAKASKNPLSTGPGARRILARV